MRKKILYLLITVTLILVGGVFTRGKLHRKETGYMEENNPNITQANTIQEKSNSLEEDNIVSNIKNTTSIEEKSIKNEISVNSSKKNILNKSNNDLEKRSETVKGITQSKEIFTSSEIPNSILNKMIGNSILDKDKVDIKQLSYLKITYWGFDEKVHVGEMVVNKNVAQEVLDIFKEIYQKKYPIEKIKLIDEYKANDEKSMADNNTSAFCYRTIANTNKPSNHSLGKAIDINPLYNPYIVGSLISPANGKKYADRSIVRKGTIKKGDDLYNAFIKRGWTWGGNWSGKKDYQHFEKK